MIVNFQELFDIVVIIFALGFIFKDVFHKRPREDHYDPLKHHSQKLIFWDNFWFACAAVAPAIILHEAAHKFVGLGFGLSSTFHAAYIWLGIGILLKLMNFDFIFFVPAYVSSYCPQAAATAFCVAGSQGFLVPTDFASAMLSVAGPLTNCLLWIVSALVLKFGNVNRKWIPLVAISKNVNMFLFIFNMVPIPGFDGYSFFTHILKVF
jgi:Zn-dependent protease